MGRVPAVSISKHLTVPSLVIILHCGCVVSILSLEYPSLTQELFHPMSAQLAITTFSVFSHLQDWVTSLEWKGPLKGLRAWSYFAGSGNGGLGHAKCLPGCLPSLW